jgi:GNAT superfamily N-acetyltransferase
MLYRRLDRHLESWLGQWPARGPGLHIVVSSRRAEPGWDGTVRPAIGVSTPRSGVLSVVPRYAEPVRHLADAVAHGDGDDDGLLAGLAAAVGRPGATTYRAVFRWTLAPADLPDAGIWVPADNPAVPDWLRVFGHEVLVALDPDTGGYLAGVGVKHHDRYGRELAVGTEPAARGRGLARRLVAQAARRVLDEGAVATYLHDPANIASARVADAAGFPDGGWTFIGVADPPPDQTASEH